MIVMIIINIIIIIIIMIIITCAADFPQDIKHLFLNSLR